MNELDLIDIGSGGYKSALTAAQLGAKLAIVGDFPTAMVYINKVVEGIRQNFPIGHNRLGIRISNGTVKCKSASVLPLPYMSEFIRSDKAIYKTSIIAEKDC